MTAAATIATVATGVGGHGVLTARQLSDQEVVKQAREGDHGAFRVLVKRHEARVYALALRLLRDPDWAQDAVQEAFLKAYRALRKFEGRSAFGTWLYRLTYNHCLDMRRAGTEERPRALLLVELAGAGVVGLFRVRLGLVRVGGRRVRESR